jgi:nucleoside-diphosphate-sugar epimerase
MTRVVVTGATGFIGRALIERLLRDGINGEPAQVVAISRRAGEAFAKSPNVEAHSLDLTTSPLEQITQAIGRDAIVFHLAADASVKAGASAARGNVLATERLVGAVHGSAPRRIVYVSSIGAVDRRKLDRCKALLDESSRPNPLTTYGKSKLAGERVVAASGLPYSIVRPTWVYGPGMRENSHLRVFVEMVRKGSLATRFRFPGRVSVIHVDDLANALVLVATQPTAAGETYFASDGAPVSIGDLFDMIGQSADRQTAQWGIPWPVAPMARLARPIMPLALQNLHSDVLAASNDKLESLGFQARHLLVGGIADLTRLALGSGAEPTWIVTGGASGIGREMVKQLTLKGPRVVAIDRNAAALESLAVECEGLECLTADLSKPEGRAKAVQCVLETPGVRAVVNCAGIGARGKVGEVSVDAEQLVLDVNASAVVALTSAAVARFRREGARGTIVNVASSAALQPLAQMAAYAASKAFVLSYSEAVAEETRGQVCVITACPAGTDTGFQAASGVKKSAGEKLMSPAKVAAKILRAARRGKSKTLFIGSRTWIMSFMARGLPRTRVAKLWAKLMEKMR